jgi:hypothetical protein
MRWLLTLALLVATPAWAQTAYPPEPSGAAPYDGGSVTNPFLAPLGCATPGHSFTGQIDDGFCHGTETGWAVDTVAMAMAGNEIAHIYTASGGEWFFEVKNPLVSPQRMFRVRGDTALTRIHYYAPTEPAYTYDITMLYLGASNPSNLHTYTILPLPDDVKPVTFGLSGGTEGPPGFRLAEDLDNGSNYVEQKAAASLTADRSVTWPDASGTVEIQQSSEPTCDATTRGQIAFVQGGAGVADTYRICAKNSSDTYAWYALATIP